MLRVSTSTRYVTPSQPCYLAGYSMRTEKSAGVLDELKCTAAVLYADGRYVVFCDVEILMLTKEIVEWVKQQLAVEYSVDPDLVTIAAIHTHAAPEIRSPRLKMYDENADASFWNGYQAQLKETIFATIADCFNKGFTPAQARYRTVSVEGFYGNRNGVGKPEDKDVTVLEFVGAHGDALAAAINIACHPTVLGADNLLISGDLLGYLSRAYFARRGIYPVMMQGAAGDMSNRNYRRGHDPAELERTGGGIAAQLFAGDDWRPLSLAHPRAQLYNYHREYDIDPAEWKQRRGELDRAMAAETAYDKHKILQSSLFAVGLKLAQPHVVADYNASILRLGELYVCKMPGELFARFGRQIKEASPAKLTLIWGYADDYAGYMADEGEYGRTYESLMSPLPKGGTEQITREICALIAE
ncbi:MAG: hypothetical protein VB021_00980 [Oscillospiraceae bacterium]|nr:hypothetical protein [Oscillospiraceae bacterium]